MIRHTAYIVIILIFLSQSIFAEKPSLDLSLIQTPAKPMALGRAYTSLANDTIAIFTNPAGLGLADGAGFTSMSVRLMGRVNYIMLGLSTKTPAGGIGLGYLSASSPAGYYTTNSGSLNSAPAIGYSESMLILCWGQKMDEDMGSREMGKLSFGAALKYYNKGFSGTSVSGYQGTGFDFDMGMILQPNDESSIGINLQNFLPTSLGGSINWNSGEKEGNSSVLKVGGSFMAFERKMLIAADVFMSQNEKYPITLHFGTQYSPTPTLALRAGIDQTANATGTSGFTSINGLTMGMGINLVGFSFDYAYKQDSVLNLNHAHYISISFSRIPTHKVEEQKIKSIEKEKTILRSIDTKNWKNKKGDENFKKLLELQKKIELKEFKRTGSTTEFSTGESKTDNSLQNLKDLEKKIRR